MRGGGGNLTTYSSLLRLWPRVAGDKLEAFRSLHLTAAATGHRLPALQSPMDGGEYGYSAASETAAAATALRQAAETLKASRAAEVSSAIESSAERRPSSPPMENRSSSW